MKPARDMLKEVPGAATWQRSLARYERDRAAAIALRNLAIACAITLDFTGDEIAAAFGLSRQRVYQIVAEVNRGR